jgi:hypothetical protein
VATVRAVSIVFAAAAAAATSVAALGDVGNPSSVPNAFLPNRAFGIGEQQVYVIERHQTVDVRFRAPNGDLVSKQLTRDDVHSVAFTVEGSDAGDIVLAAVSDATAQPDSAPSPTVRADGTISAAGPLAAIGAGALVLGSVPPALAEGTTWNTSGALRLPFGPMQMRMTNTSATWEGGDAVVQVASTGSVDASGSVTVPGFGPASLRGSGSTKGISFIDTDLRLLLGSTYSIVGSGNAQNGRGEHGTYLMKAAYTLKLARYVPGRPGPPAYAPTELPRMIETVSPDQIIHGGSVDEIAHPAPTDNVFSSSPLPAGSPIPLPDESLAPVPLTVSSGAPLASPLPPPPTPVPTRTPR